MKTILFTQWNLFRSIRFAAGILITGQGFYSHDWLLVFAGASFTALTLFNISCCANGQCNTAVNTSAKDLKDNDYEEVV